MRYLKEYKNWEIDRWKKVDDFGTTKGKSVEELGDEIEFVGGFPDNFIEGGDGEKPMTDEQVKRMYSAIAKDVKNNREDEAEDDKEIDDSLENK
jgi:hypothetical protein